MNFGNLVVSAALAASLGAAHAASTIVIDNFDTYVGSGVGQVGFDFTSTGALASDGSDTVPGADTGLTGAVLRTVELDADGDQARIRNTLGRASYSNDDGVLSFAKFSYSFDPQSLLAGNAFSLQVVNSDSGTVNYNFTVSTGVNTSTKTGVLPIVANSVFSVLFVDFVGTADFGNLDKIELTLTTATAGADVSIDAFGVNLPPVPEASTYAAVGFMGLAAFGAYRRARK